MSYEISRREVLNNLIRLKDYLLEAQREKGEKQIRLLLNYQTGDMRFAKKIDFLEAHLVRKEGKKESAADWKEVLFTYRWASPGWVFELVDLKGHALNPHFFSESAWQIASETMNYFNYRAKEVGEPKGEISLLDLVLEDLSSIHLAPPQERIESQPGWSGALSRIQAEERLKNRPIGTYLLRQGDEVTLSMASHLAEENLLSVRPYLMTLVEEEEKIADILLLQTNKGWTLYRDDPDLQDRALYPFFPSFQLLLRHIHPKAQFPINISST